MIVNELKTKAIQIGRKNDLEIFFNKAKVCEVHAYKYLGLLLSRPNV